MTFRTKQAIDFWLGGLLLLLLFLPVRGLGRLLRRDHSLARRRGCVVVKLVGAGSLFLATPALQAIRGKFPPGKFFLVGTHAMTGFAEGFDWFDECWTIDDTSLVRLVISSVRTLWKIAWRCDHLIDLEVYSRLTTVISVLTTVRNRIGFVDKVVFWRRGFYTHITFFNAQSPVYAFYDMLAAWFGVDRVPVTSVHTAFRARVLAAPLQQASHYRPAMSSSLRAVRSSARSGNCAPTNGESCSRTPYPTGPRSYCWAARRTACCATPSRRI